MTSEEILQTFEAAGVIHRNSHFVFVSGKHSQIYFNKDALFMHAKEASRVCRELAKRYTNDVIDIIAAPAVAGIIVGQWVAYHLSELRGREALSIYTDKTADDGQILKRLYDKVVPGKKVLIVEDSTTTGSSIAKVVTTLRGYGANVVAAGVLVNRGGPTVADAVGVPFTALSEFPVTTYAAEECPMCQDGMPIRTDLGHGKKYLEGKNDHQR